TLDGEKRELEERTLVITDGKDPIAIAGVMGGENSEIDSETTSIILESANFEPTLIRKTSQKLGLRTESSMRFEKSLDPCLAESGLARAKQLLEKICSGARVSGEAVDIYNTEKKNFGFSRGPIEVSSEWLSQMIGQEIKEDKIIDILKNLGFEADKASGGGLSITIPSWRATKDISIKEDLVEEVGRIYGYENIEPKSASVDLERPLPNENRELERRVKNILSEGAAMTEVYNYSFVGEAKLKKIGIDSTDYIRLANPFSSQHALLRQNLVPNLLENIRLNQPNYSRISLFEVGEIYLSIDGEIRKDPRSGETLPYEEKRLALIEAGDGKEDLFFHIKGKVDHLLGHFDFIVEYIPGETPPAWAQEDIFAHITVQ
ncbi:MAG TPA: phenylalanine--tRNA ligase beta subunit-related protein, partial [Patescibacteria group bacterium]|nr:phenylalanine--tRNA ligase beta subunit-related protein [Patescibacteria group bacterium]